MIALLSSRDAAALVAVERLEESEGFAGIDFVNLGPAHCLVFEIHYTLNFRDVAYSRDPVEGIVRGKPQLVEPGDTYRVVDEKVYGTVREERGDEWLTEGLGELTVQVRYVPGAERVMTASVMIDAKADSFALKLLPADRAAVAAAIG